ncbi:MAG: amidohydrolase family protein [Bacteroidota bacterium]
MKKSLAVLFTLFIGNFICQNPSPAPKQNKSVLLMNGYLHIGNGKTIENSLVGFRDGKIDLVADAKVSKIDPKKYDTIIQLNGKHIYPAFIAPNSTLGLTEVDAVRATLDFSEVGGYNPHVRSLIAFNTDSKINSTVRTNGVLYCQVTPRSGTISGSSSVVSLDAWNWEDAVLKADDGIHLNYPRMQQRSPGEDQVNVFEQQLNSLKKFFTDAKGYCSSKNPEEKNLRFEAMRGIFDGTKTLYIHADYAKELISAVNFSREYSIKKMVLVGAKDAWKITALLKQNSIPVMLNRVHDLPSLNEDDIDAPYKTAYLLQKDSVEFCLQNAGDMEAMNTRNLPFLAGTAAAYGLSKEDAIKSITLSAAKILGIDSKIGSVENGKFASLFVSEGDALDMRTNIVRMAWIEGRQISLTNAQQYQYEKYKVKYGLK